MRKTDEDYDYDGCKRQVMGLSFDSLQTEPSKK